MASLFKKPFKTSGNNVVKKSVKRNLVNTLKKTYPNLTDEEWHELMPPKGAELSICKMQGTHTVIYLLENTPLFFDVDGRGDLYPSVYALWRAPKLMDTIIVQPNVFNFLLKGADLFLPGVLAPEGGYQWGVGAKKSVTLLSYGLPIAVGFCTVDNKDVEMNGLKGKGMKILHFYKDKLWEMGPRSNPQNHAGWKMSAPWPGFEHYYAEHGAKPSGTEEEDAIPDDDDDEDNDGNDGEGENAAADSSSSSSSSSSAAGEEQVDGEEGGVEAEPVQYTTEEMDEFLKTAFLTSLKTLVKKEDMPILFNTFFADYVMPCDKDNVIDIKKSSYKKTGNFLIAMAESGLISIEELSPGVHQVLDLDRSHPDYKSFKPAADAVQAAESSEVVAKKPLIVDLFGVTQPLLAIFNAHGHEKKQLYTKKEAAALLWAYVAANSLEADGGRKVKIDENLQKGLYKKGQEVPPSLPKKELVDLFISKMSPYHEVNRDDNSEVRKGAVKPVEIILEARQGGKKYVTRIGQLESFAVNPDVLAKELQALCAAASTVRPGEGKTAGKEVAIQGLVVKQATEHLIKKYNVPRKYITTVDRSKKKGKK